MNLCRIEKKVRNVCRQRIVRDVVHNSANLLAVLKVQREDIRVIKAFRPHEEDENTHRKRINSKTHSKVDQFENAT